MRLRFRIQCRSAASVNRPHQNQSVAQRPSLGVNLVFEIQLPMGLFLMYSVFQPSENKFVSGRFLVRPIRTNLAPRLSSVSR